ncbi:MAG TPA: methyltransferase domain-containing protein [Gemmatimonadales bacterium]|nr:methyltransferase domain-containing protein [Gemmatimonadales bacterium]
MTKGALTVRRVGTELLDDPAAPAGIVELSLRNVARSNRWFGGADALRFGLGRLLEPLPRGKTLTLLDLGTGFGDMPAVGVAWARRHGVRLRAVGLELSPVAARLARARGVPMIVGCAGAPPIADKSVDMVSVSMVAHHFEPDSVVTLLRICNRLARVGVVISDLQRTALGAAAFRIGARLLGFDPVTRHDGLTSIRRGYTRTELATLLTQAGVPAQVFRRPGWRLVAVWRTGAA